MNRKPQGQISSPEKSTHIGSRVHIRGRVNDIPVDRKLWIAHRRAPGGIVWPKSPRVGTDADGQFSLTVHEGGIPGPIEVSLLLVDTRMDEQFAEWLKQGDRTGHYPGIEVFEPAAIELDSVSVVYDHERPLKVFFSYSHEDEALRDALEKHLTILKRQRLIETWHDRRLVPGAALDQSIDREIERADVILLLVSASFVASDYCYDREMQRALARHQAGEATVIPIIIRPVDWKHAPFGDLLALPTDAKPVTSWRNTDEAWFDVASGIRKAIESMR